MHAKEIIIIFYKENNYIGNMAAMHTYAVNIHAFSIIKPVNHICLLVFDVISKYYRMDDCIQVIGSG